MLFNLIRNRRYYFALSLLFILPGLLAMIYNVVVTPSHTPWKLSVDFRPGSRFVLKFNGDANEDKIRTVFTQFGFNNPEISRLGAANENL